VNLRFTQFQSKNFAAVLHLYVPEALEYPVSWVSYTGKSPTAEGALSPPPMRHC
jgi:hypothetical protein